VNPAYKQKCLDFCNGPHGQKLKAAGWKFSPDCIQCSFELRRGKKTYIVSSTDGTSEFDFTSVFVTWNMKDEWGNFHTLCSDVTVNDAITAVAAHQPKRKTNG
jgi:hypothetical protein